MISFLKSGRYSSGDDAGVQGRGFWEYYVTMRHRASLLASLEGISRITFLIAKELAQNSRSGLTPRFLARKLEVSQEEIEYLVDVHHKLLYTDLTRIKLTPEGFPAVRRIQEGLESHGDVAAFFQRLRRFSDQELQRMEDRLGLDGTRPKREIAEKMLDGLYRHPDSVLHYVASRDFSTEARVVFDLVWQSRDGILPVSQLYTVHGGTEFEVEQALWELFQGCACFELFRFDGEQRLVRAVTLLKEARDFRRGATPAQESSRSTLHAVTDPVNEDAREPFRFCDAVCRVAASIAAHPARLRADGELFREDLRRLESICQNESEPSLNACLWTAEGVGWIVRVDNVLCVGELDCVLEMNRLQRQRLLYEFLLSQGDNAQSRGLLEKNLLELRPGTWYRVMDFIAATRTQVDEEEPPRLRHVGAHYEYVSPSRSGGLDTRLARALEEHLEWLGVVQRGDSEGESCFRITSLGMALLRGGEEVSGTDISYPNRADVFVVQPNYEVVLQVNDLDPLLTVPLDLFAERCGSFPVALYKLTREAFIRAMQQGHHPENFIAFLLEYNRGPLPENVLITLKDWCGTMKQVRLRTYHVVEADDPLVIAELEHHRHWKECFRALESHKVLRYQDISKTELKRALEKEGYVVK